MSSPLNELSTVGRINLLMDDRCALKPTELAHVHTRMTHMNVIRVLGGSQRVDDAAGDYIVDYVKAAMSSLIHVKRVEVYNDPYFSFPEKVQMGLVALFKASSSLEELCTNTGLFLFDILQKLPPLPKLKILIWYVDDHVSSHGFMDLKGDLIKWLVSNVPQLEELSVDGLRKMWTSADLPPHPSLRTLRLGFPLDGHTYPDITLAKKYEPDFPYVTPSELLALHRLFPRLHTLTGVVTLARLLCSSVTNFLSLLSRDSYVSLIFDDVRLCSQMLDTYKHHKWVCVKSLHVQYKCSEDAQQLTDLLAQPEIAAMFPCVHTVFLDPCQESKGVHFPSTTLMTVLPSARYMIIGPETTWPEREDLETDASKAIFDLASRMPTARESMIILNNVPTIVLEQARTLLRASGINNTCSLI